MATLATTGALVGTETVIIGGPIGGFAGTVPGALCGEITGWLPADQFRRCPRCGKVFKT